MKVSYDLLRVFNFWLKCRDRQNRLFIHIDICNNPLKAIFFKALYNYGFQPKVENKIRDYLNEN